MTILRPAVVALATGLVVIPAWALEVSQSVEVAAPPDEVWQAIRGFCTIAEWHPMIAECVDSEQNGVAMRTLTTVDGAVLVERRVQYSDEGMSYSYEIVESPLPVADYESTLAVMDGPRGLDDHLERRVRRHRRPRRDRRSRSIDGIYEAGLEALKERLR